MTKILIIVIGLSWLLFCTLTLVDSTMSVLLIVLDYSSLVDSMEGMRDSYAHTHEVMNNWFLMSYIFAFWKFVSGVFGVYFSIQLLRMKSKGLFGLRALSAMELIFVFSLMYYLDQIGKAMSKDGLATYHSLQVVFPYGALAMFFLLTLIFLTRNFVVKHIETGSGS